MNKVVLQTISSALSGLISNRIGSLVVYLTVDGFLPLAERMSDSAGPEVRQL